MLKQGGTLETSIKSPRNLLNRQNIKFATLFAPEIS